MVYLIQYLGSLSLLLSPPVILAQLTFLVRINPSQQTLSNFHEVFIIPKIHNAIVVEHVSQCVQVSSHNSVAATNYDILGVPRLVYPIYRPGLKTRPERSTDTIIRINRRGY